MRLGAPRAFPLFLLLSTVFRCTTAQGTGRFLQPEGVDASATGSDRFDSSIQWIIGDKVTVRWEAEFETVTLRLWQGVYEGHWWHTVLLKDEPNTLSYTWIVGPVLSQAQKVNQHFELLDSLNPERTLNSKEFIVYNGTETLTETFLTTTRERTVTREVTVTQSGDVESTGTSPSSTPTDIDTQTTSDSVPLPTSTNTSSDNTAMKVGLGVGLGVGLPLLALVGAGLYFFGKKSGGKGEQPLPNMPSAPPVTSTGAETGWHPDYTLGGIESVGSQPGGAVTPSQRS